MLVLYQGAQSWTKCSKPKKAGVQGNNPFLWSVGYLLAIASKYVAIHLQEAWHWCVSYSQSLHLFHHCYSRELLPVHSGPAYMGLFHSRRRILIHFSKCAEITACSSSRLWTYHSPALQSINCFTLSGAIWEADKDASAPLPKPLMKTFNTAEEFTSGSAV